MKQIFSSLYKFNLQLKKYDWVTMLFLVATLAVSLIFVPVYLFYFGVQKDILLFALLFAVFTNLSITAGYHRQMAHKAYDAKRWVQWLYLFGGAASFQGPALKWCSDHRVHHSKVDTDDDPYTITKGFWYAHIRWLFFKESADRPIHAPDLERNKDIIFQFKYYPVLAILAGLVFPTIVGALMGSAWEGFLFGGVLRTVLTQHSTFLVNSIAHTWGQRPYSLEITARDNFIVSLMTHGEGYHNFHHRFQADYRNGIQWYHWDPTKWWINILSWIGAAHRLYSVPALEIQKAKLLVDEQKLIALGVQTDHLHELKLKIEKLYSELKTTKSEYQKQYAKYKKSFENETEKLRNFKKLIKLKQKRLRVELEKTLHVWSIEIQALSLRHRLNPN